MAWVEVAYFSNYLLTRDKLSMEFRLIREGGGGAAQFGAASTQTFNVAVQIKAGPK